MSTKKVAVLQSDYIPWKGYFDIIHDVDLFIFYDDVQFTKNDWRNRNRIKTPSGSRWLSIPVGSKIHRFIYEADIKDPIWGKRHWDIIFQSYRRSKYFKIYSSFFQHVYLDLTWGNISDLNQFMIKNIAREFLGITTQFDDSRLYTVSGCKQERLLTLLNKVNATVYVSGPAAKHYIDDKDWSNSGIQLVFKDYSNYPEYPQVYPPFDHFVSIIDLLFNVGPSAPYYIWGWRST